MQKWTSFTRVFFSTLLVLMLFAGVFSPRVDSAQAAVERQPLLTCPAATITQWSFTNDTVSSRGTDTFVAGAGVSAYGFLTSSPSSSSNPSINVGNWDAANDYFEFKVDTTGYDAILFDLNYRATSTGPITLELHYSIDGTSFTKFATETLTRDSAFHSLNFDLSSISGLDANSSAAFRIYASGGGAGNLALDDVTLSSKCIPPPVGTGNISITNQVNDSTALPSEANSNVCAYVIFKITVANEDAINPAVNIQVNNTWTVDSSALPTWPLAKLEYVSSSASSGVYDHASGIWSGISLAVAGTAGDSATLTLTAKVVNAGEIVNHAEVLNSTNPTFAADSLVHAKTGNDADLAISQSWSRSTSAADTAILAVTITNNGPDNASGVYAEDKLPSGLTYQGVSFSTSGMSYNSGTGVWSAGGIEYGKSATMYLTVKVDKEGDATDNEARILQSNQCDQYSGNNQDTSINGKVHIADLSLALSGNSQGTIFTVTVTNAGPDDVSNAEAEIPLTGYTYISSGGDGTYNPSTKIWSIGALPDGSSKTLTLTVSTAISPHPSAWAEINEAYDVNGFKIVDYDSVPNNCPVTSSSVACAEDDDDKYPVQQADVLVTQTASNLNPDPQDIYDTDNDQVVFTVRVANQGPYSATGLKIIDALPYGLNYESASFNANSACPVPSGTYYSSETDIWSIGALANGACAEMRLVARAYANGEIVNSASVYAVNESDPNAYNNSASVTLMTYRSVVINEIAWAGTRANAAHEWLELYNPGSANINVAGWKIKLVAAANTLYDWSYLDYCASSNPAYDFITLANYPGTIAKGGYYLLESNSTATSAAQDQIYSAALLPDEGAMLILCDDQNNFIDTANYEGHADLPNAWPQGATSLNRPTMERQKPDPERDSLWITNEGVTKNGYDADGFYIYGTPRAKNSTPPTPTKAPPTPTKAPPLDRLVINEFLARPGYDWNHDGRVDVFDEFIEIKNIGITNVRLNGWRIDDGEGGSAAITFGDNVVLKPGDIVVYYGLKTNILLSDGGDTVRLYNPGNKLFDTYTYVVAKAEGPAFCRLPDGNGSWYEDCVPTPGLANAREGVLPVMGDVNYQSPVCSLPDTLPEDFLYAECRGYGAHVWRAYWDFDWLPISNPANKWQSFIE